MPVSIVDNSEVIPVRSKLSGLMYGTEEGRRGMAVLRGEEPVLEGQTAVISGIHCMVTDVHEKQDFIESCAVIERQMLASIPIDLERLDAGIRPVVECLLANGVETFESCEGG